MAVGSPKTAHSYAYESLRSQILAGDLAPGTPLRQASLAETLGVSMTPVREALRDLTTEGLVTLSPHRGATVTVLDVADAREIHRVRLALEPDACAAAVEPATDDVLEQAELLYQRMSEASSGQWVALNLQYHVLLLSPTPSARVRNILGSLLEAAALYVGVAMTHRRGPDPQVEHREILDAYLARDPDAAADAVRRHIQSSLDSLDWDGDAAHEDIRHSSS
jgi:DNA-binding GntR family transcriptional regulator